MVREGPSEKQKQEMSHMQGCGTAGQGNSKEAPSSPGSESQLFTKTFARGGSPVSPEEQSHFEADARLSQGRAGQAHRWLLTSSTTHGLGPSPRPPDPLAQRQRPERQGRETPGISETRHPPSAQALQHRISDSGSDSVCVFCQNLPLCLFDATQRVRDGTIQKHGNASLPRRVCERHRILLPC